jgi:hypothetical protein
MAILQKGTYDLLSLSIIAGTVIAIAPLLYLTQISLQIIAVAGCAFLFEEIKGVQHWQTLAPWIVLGFVWLSWMIHSNDHIILQQLDILHQKIDALNVELEEIKTKQDQSA